MLNVFLCAYLPSVYLLCKISVHVFCCCLEAKSCLCDSMDLSLPGSSFHGISQARILEWTAISVSNGPRFVFYPFLNQIFFFWILLNFECFKNILDISPLLDMLLPNIFYQSNILKFLQCPFASLCFCYQIYIHSLPSHRT